MEDLTALSPFISSLSSLLVPCLGAYLTYRYACKRLHIETKIEQCQREADALQAVWCLLRYMSDTENAKSILRWVEERQPEGGRSKRYYLQVENAQHFVQEVLPAAFYEAHIGLYWGDSIKDRLFEYRSILYGLLLKTQAANKGEKEIEILKPELSARLLNIFHELHQQLRECNQQIWGKKHSLDV